MRLGGLITFLFILYCVTAGMFLVFAPWGPLWERVLTPASAGLAADLLSLPVVRAAASGFGLVHLIWALNDLEGLFLLPKPYGNDDAA